VEKKTYLLKVRLSTSFPDPKQVIEEAVDDYVGDSFATVLSCDEE